MKEVLFWRNVPILEKLGVEQFNHMIGKGFRKGGILMKQQLFHHFVAGKIQRLLRLIVVDGLSKLKVLFCLPTAFWGKHTQFTGIHIFRCKKVEVFSTVPLAVHKDGESAGIQETFSVSIEKEPVKIILP